MEADREPVHVEQGKREHESVVRGPAPRERERRGAREQVGVAEPGTLRRARGARRVAEHRVVTGRARVELGRGRVGKVDRRAARHDRRRGSHPRSSPPPRGRRPPRPPDGSHARSARPRAPGRRCSPARRRDPHGGLRRARRRGAIDAAPLTTTRSPGRRPAPRSRPADPPRALLELARGDPVLAVARSRDVTGAAAQRALQAAGSDPAATRSRVAGSTPGGRWRAHAEVITGAGYVAPALRHSSPCSPSRCFGVDSTCSEGFSTPKQDGRCCLCGGCVRMLLPMPRWVVGLALVSARRRAERGRDDTGTRGAGLRGVRPGGRARP